MEKYGTTTNLTREGHSHITTNWAKRVITRCSKNTKENTEETAKPLLGTKPSMWPTQKTLEGRFSDQMRILLNVFGHMGKC